MRENPFIFCKFLLTVIFLTSAGLLVGCGGSSETKAVAVNQSNEANKKLIDSPTTPNVDGNAEIAALDSLKIPIVSYCDLIKNARDYDKKIVCVRAIYFSGFEKIYLYDDRCEANQPPSAPEDVPAETWAQLDKSFETKGDSAEAKLNNQLNAFGRKDVTVVGRFYSANEEDAPNRFGHLNCCRFQFSIMRVEAVRDLDGKTLKTQNGYGKTVKFAPAQKIEFADFTLEFYPNLNLLVAVPQPNQKLPKYAFHATRAGGESAMIYGNSESDDNAPLKFKFGGKQYQLETGIADKSGKLARDELIVRKLD